MSGKDISSSSSFQGAGTVVSEEEVEELLVDGGKPATTKELVGMLKEAGTELTVKYLTGELTFNEFCKRCEKFEPPKSKSASTITSDAPSVSSSSTVGASVPIHDDILAFDQLLKEAEEEEEEDNNSDNDAEEDVEEGDEDDIDEEDDENEKDSEFLDAGEMLDRKDEEWVPDEFEPKKIPKTMKVGKKRKQGMMLDKFDSYTPTQKRRRRAHEIPKHLTGAQGRALLLRAQGNTEEAIVALYDIIRKAPNASAPYQTLGSIHEEKGDLKQALKFMMVAANLRKSYANEWFELVEMCMKLNEDKLAHTCFLKAMRYAQTSAAKFEIQTQKSIYYERCNQPLRALQCRANSLSYMDKNDPASILALARSITQDYLKLQDVQGAIDTLQFIHTELPNDIDAEDVFHLLELLMLQQNYEKSLEILIQHCGVKLKFSGQYPPAKELPAVLSQFCLKQVTLDSVEVPTEMPIDMWSKLVQCLIMIKVLPNLDVLKDVIRDLRESDLEEFGEIYFSIAETMVECAYHEEAKPILQALVACETFHKVEVWLALGHCLNSLGDIQAAADAFTRVIEMAPDNYGARVTLSSLQQQMGHNDIALQVLSKGSSGEGAATSDQLLLLRKCQLLHSQGRIEDFASCARKLFAFNMRGRCSPVFMRMLISLRTLKARRKFYPYLSSGKKSQQEEEVSDELTELEKGEQKKFKDDMWDVYVKMCKVIREIGSEKELLDTAIQGITCPAFCEDEVKVKEAEFFCLKIGPVNRCVYNLAKHLVTEEKENNQAWNLYCYIMTKFKNISDLRFAMRAMMKDPNSPALGMLNGSARMNAGSYKQALGQFLTLFRRNPQNDLAILCCGLCLLHITSQGHTGRKNLLIPQAMCMLNLYKKLRGECQETYYNMGRALYQLNLQYAAMHYYKKALELPPVIADAEGMYDLTYEIAHNLALIYRKCDNLDSARYYMEKYCVI